MIYKDLHRHIYKGNKKTKPLKYKLLHVLYKTHHEGIVSYLYCESYKSIYNAVRVQWEI